MQKQSVTSDTQETRRAEGDLVVGAGADLEMGLRG